jgi:MFS family permease
MKLAPKGKALSELERPNRKVAGKSNSLLVGNMLAPSHALATLSISIFVVKMAACTLPAGVIAQRHGRHAAFLIGTGFGVLVSMFAALAVVMRAFWLFCFVTFFGVLD